MENNIPFIKDDFQSNTAYSKLSSNIKFASIDKEIKTIAVVSSVENEFKSTVTINLANQYKKLGKKVIILDFDLRLPTMHKALKIENTKGIVDYVIEDNVNINDLIKTSSEGIDLITSGSKTQFVDKVLSSSKIKALLEELKNTYDYIILDTAPIIITADTLSISPIVDGVIVVVKQNKTTKKEASTTLNQLEFSKANILGLVLTNVKVKSSKYSKYYTYK